MPSLNPSQASNLSRGNRFNKFNTAPLTEHANCSRAVVSQFTQLWAEVQIMLCWRDVSSCENKVVHRRRARETN